MNFDPEIHVTFGDTLSEISLPKMYRVRQHFDDSHITDIDGHVRREMVRFLQGKDLKGKRIAITIGSRGISFYAVIVRAIVESFRAHGAAPFLITSMGSHAGATEKGQVEMAEHLGIDARALGVELRSSMETRIIGHLPCGTPVHCAVDALEADGIFLLNKIKPHADFKGAHESGLLKMSVIGLGKHRGCSAMHKLGFARFAEAIPQAASVVFENAPVLGGLAIVENAYDMPMVLEALDKAEIFAREKELLRLAKSNIAKLCVSQPDILIIDEIGKDISGEGMDPNVTGRPGSGLMAGFEDTKIGSIIIRGVSEASAGNGVGIGMADISTLRCARTLDLGLMYTNSITAGILSPSRLPVFLNNDLEALKVAIRVSAGDHTAAPRICWVRSTLHLDELLVSEALLPELAEKSAVTIMEEVPYTFDNENYLITPLK